MHTEQYDGYTDINDNGLNRPIYRHSDIIDNLNLPVEEEKSNDEEESHSLFHF